MLSRIISNASALRQGLFNPRGVKQSIKTRAQEFKKMMTEPHQKLDDNDLIGLSPKEMARMDKVGHDGLRAWERDAEWFDSD